MMDPILPENALWAATVARARQELAQLPMPRRDWLAAQLERIGALQGEIDRVFRAIDGPAVCAACRGGCCSRAKYHVTLTNLLGYLLAGEEPPSPDFACTCPFVDVAGCRLPVAHRPFNCIIFFCDALESRLTGAQRTELQRLEQDLRTSYTAVAEYCPGASLRGLLIAAARCGGRPLLMPAA